MNSNTQKAKEILTEGGYTLVLYSEEDSLVSTERGVKPLLQLIESGNDYSSFSAADKVVGSAAAHLYVLLKIKEVHAFTLSEKAKAVFEKYGVSFSFTELVPFIINRKGDGPCPMEEATKDAVTPEQAAEKIKEALLGVSVP